MIRCAIFPTPAHRSECERMMRVLVAKGADPFVRDKNGKSSLTPKSHGAMEKLYRDPLFAWRVNNILKGVWERIKWLTNEKEFALDLYSKSA